MAIFFFFKLPFALSRSKYAGLVATKRKEKKEEVARSRSNMSGAGSNGLFAIGC